MLNVHDIPKQVHYISITMFNVHDIPKQAHYTCTSITMLNFHDIPKHVHCTSITVINVHDIPKQVILLSLYYNMMVNDILKRAFYFEIL